MRGYLGCYTDQQASATGASGISVLEADGETLTVRPGPVAKNPTYLAPSADRRFLYAVMGSPDGDAVGAFKIDGAALIPWGVPQLTGGTNACHLSVHPSGSVLLSANYGDGSLAVHPIAEDGSLAPRTDLGQLSGAGPHPQRQRGPHAHMIVTEPNGAHILATDLGTDSVHRYTLASGRLSPAGVISVPPGAGPRHLAFHPDGQRAYVVNEIDSTVTILDLATFQAGGTFSTVPANGAVVSLPSAIRVAQDGRFCYVANRGPDTIGVLEISSDGTELNVVATVPCGGAHPRDLVLVGELLYVANQHSNLVTSFRIDPDSGVPTPSGAPLRTQAPSCLVFVDQA